MGEQSSPIDSSPLPSSWIFHGFMHFFRLICMLLCITDDEPRIEMVNTAKELSEAPPSFFSAFTITNYSVDCFCFFIYIFTILLFFFLCVWGGEAHNLNVKLPSQMDCVLLIFMQRWYFEFFWTFPFESWSAKNILKIVGIKVSQMGSNS